MDPLSPQLCVCANADIPTSALGLLSARSACATSRGPRQAAANPPGHSAASLWPAPRPPRSRAQQIDPRKGQRWPTPFPGRPALNAPLPPWRRRREEPFSPVGPSWLSPGGRGSWRRLRQTARRDLWQRRWRSAARPACVGRGRKEQGRQVRRDEAASYARLTRISPPSASASAARIVSQVSRASS